MVTKVTFETEEYRKYLSLSDTILGIDGTLRKTKKSEPQAVPGFNRSWFAQTRAIAASLLLAFD